jgi:hypothetical protein
LEAVFMKRCVVLLVYYYIFLLLFIYVDWLLLINHVIILGYQRFEISRLAMPSLW